MCERVGWFNNNICDACIPKAKEKSVKYMKKLDSIIKMEKKTKDSKKRLDYCREIIDVSGKLLLLCKASMPREAREIKRTIRDYTAQRYDIEWNMTKVSADKLMKRAKAAVTKEGKVNFTKKALVELRKLKKRRPEHRKNKDLLNYITSCETFVNDEQQ